MYNKAKESLHASHQSDKIITHYISAMEAWTIGNLHWSFNSGRYFGSKHEEVKKTLLVEFTPMLEEQLFL